MILEKISQFQTYTREYTQSNTAWFKSSSIDEHFLYSD